MTRTARQNWGILSRFMWRVNQRYPGVAQILTPTTLFCENRFVSRGGKKITHGCRVLIVNKVFIFRRFCVQGGKIHEESSFQIPQTEDYEKKIRAQLRYFLIKLHFLISKIFSIMKYFRHQSKLSIDDLIASFVLQ